MRIWKQKTCSPLFSCPVFNIQWLWEKIDPRGKRIRIFSPKQQAMTEEKYLKLKLGGIMNMIDQIKKIEEYICTNYEDWDLDDPMEEGDYQDYQQIAGASLEELQSLEEKLDIALPKDVKALYQYKNGSRYFSLLLTRLGEMEVPFCLMSLEEIQRSKESFQNKDAQLSDFADYFSKEDIEKMKDNRIQPYLFNRRWLPFAQYCNSCYLMLDFAPGEKGQVGQIICYIHDPDEVLYVAPSLSDLVAGIVSEM